MLASIDVDYNTFTIDHCNTWHSSIVMPGTVVTNFMMMQPNKAIRNSFTFESQNCKSFFQKKTDDNHNRRESRGVII